MCRRGPIAPHEDAEFVLASCPACDGFHGASRMERLPEEEALTAQTRRFKGIYRP